MRDVLRALFLSIFILCLPVRADDRAPVPAPARPSVIVNGSFWAPHAALSDLDLRRAALGVVRLFTDDDDAADAEDEAMSVPSGKQQHTLQAGNPPPRRRHAAAPLQRGNVISFMRPRIQVHIAPPLPPVFATSPPPVDAGRRPGAVSR
ncbi:MAG: hypothetical protein U0166_15495 [Acidobacteriota bacterium]